ncbi:LysR family transcriptional regulator [Burkholderia singularis]|nr:LysR family transcriptional regulator [Burkholderia singularis]
MDLLTAMRVFVNVAELGSFVRAAKCIGISTAVATRHIVALENRLETRLIYRTTRSLSLTEAGSKYLISARQLLEDLEKIEEEISSVSRGPIGTLRIASSPGFAQHCLTPLLPSFMTTFPNISPDLTTTERQVDFIKEGFDVGILTSQQIRHPSTVTRSIINIRMIACASQQYLNTHGTPHHPNELEKHSVLVLSNLYLNGNKYKFTFENEIHQPKLSSRILTNNDEIIRHLALLGFGIAILPEYTVNRDIELGNLQEILSNYELPKLEMYIAYPNRQHMPIKVRSFIDYLLANFNE